MKKLVLACLASLALSTGFAANAMADIKVGIVDMRAAVEQTEENGVLKKLKSEADTRRKTLEADQKALLALKQDIEANQAILSPEKLREKAAEYQESLLKLQQKMQTYEQEMAELQAKQLGEVQKKMMKISEEIAKEKSLDLILEHSAGGVVYFNSSFDVTPELVKRYKAAK